MTAAEEFASRLRSAAPLLAKCTGALADGSERFEVTSAQISAVFEGSSSAAAERVAASMEEAREKLSDAMVLLTTAADELRTYTSEVLSNGAPDAPPPAAATHDDGLTNPSRAPDPNALPEGEREFAPRASADVQESLEYQYGTAVALSRAGYRVRQLPNTGQGANPDFEIEGRLFDCYSPKQGTSADSARTSLRQKSREQASRFVVNLDRSDLDASELRSRLLAMPSRRVHEVLVVRNDTVSRIWP